MFSKFLQLHRDPSSDCKKKNLFTKDETIFFRRLQQALPNCSIFPHIPLATLVTPNSGDEREDRRMAQILKDRHVDFCVFNKELVLLCVIELEGRIKNDDSEESQHDKNYIPNVDFLNNANIKSIRWNRSNLPSFEQMLRILAPFSPLESPRARSSTNTVIKPDADIKRKAPVVADLNATLPPEHGNPFALSLQFIVGLTPDQHIRKEYPHIWQRICLFASDPKHLKTYLESLFIQNRPVKRIGLPQNVVNEVISIQNENNRFIGGKATNSAWENPFAQR